jgi:hypothetical protein
MFRGNTFTKADTKDELLLIQPFLFKENCRIARNKYKYKTKVRWLAGKKVCVRNLKEI